MRTERMSPLLALGILVSGLCSRVHCLPENVTPEEQHKGTSVDGHSLASSNTDFAFSLYKQLALKNPNKNVIFSPLSISIALAFLSLGAHGPTVTEILEGLKFNLTETPETEIHQGFQHLLQTFNQPSNQLQLSVGNAMFVSEELKLLDKFRKDAEAFYASEVLSTNFKDSEAAVKLINEYVKNKTHGKIEKLFNDLDVLTNLILLNYIFFKGGCLVWGSEEQILKIHQGFQHLLQTFNQPSNQLQLSVGNAMFVSEELKLLDKFRKDAEAFYASEVLSTNFKDSEAAVKLINEYVKNKTHGKIEKLFNDLDVLTNLILLNYIFFKGHPCAVEQPLWLPTFLHIDKLSLPRFSISSDYQLRDILSQLGIKKIFTSDADFSGITDDHKLAVSQVVHKAVLDVGEEGTEGAAVTAVIMFTSLPLHTLTVSFNRPFLLSIFCKETQSIIFLGKVTNPKGA
ncbi:PREDICTED: serpin A3-7-like [Bison bison bison]|uniref:Serpin A3-7-like n=1 Tax=Bison bison bison TaxID=43346 RepID=A0A6P3H618_BISBB|nr:PREDICTED: serpin A3-7-like [Bison bison bison]